MEFETAGDPITGCKWTSKTTGKIARQLERVGVHISPNTVGRLLKDQSFSLRVNMKTLESGLRNPPDPETRDRQFRHIKRRRQDCVRRGIPIISVDTKSRVLLGRFHRKGRRWSDAPIKVLDHDFPSDAKGVAIPYGIYDVERNEGLVCVGTSRDTAEFAVDAIRSWWIKAGKHHYQEADELLILADCGGSNSCRTRLWKYQLQTDFCNRVGLTARVCHYPPGSSKWNPIEHRMFSFISQNWAGEPLETHESVLKYIRTTRTEAGLRMRACLIDKEYEKGIEISDSQMRQISLKRSRLHPKWNYSIAPSKM